MSDPIELSREEEQAAYFAISPLLGAVALNRQQPDYAVTPVVAAIVKAVNKVRVGDPVGTIRRSTYGAIAVRAATPPDPGGHENVHWWRIHHPEDNVVTHGGQPCVSKWTVIFSPEAS